MTSAAEAFWRGEGGRDYTDRNVGRKADNVAFFVRALQRAWGLARILELGAGSGENLAALRVLLPHTALMAVEINEYAASKITEADYVFRSSIQKFDPPVETPPQLVFTKGVLIHIPPDELAAVYDKLYACSERYILLAEYYNPTPMEVRYHGHFQLLWKRDFAGELMELHTDLDLLDYGFVGHLDRWPQDDVTWHLLSKTQR